MLHLLELFGVGVLVLLFLLHVGWARRACSTQDRRHTVGGVGQHGHCLLIKVHLGAFRAQNLLLGGGLVHILQESVLAQQWLRLFDHRGSWTGEFLIENIFVFDKGPWLLRVELNLLGRQVALVEYELIILVLPVVHS